MENSDATHVLDRPRQRGSLFGLRQRLATSHAEPFVPSARFETASGRPRVLLVEDDVHLRLALKERLTHDGCDVTELDDGVSALYCILSCDYDAVILDLSLPSRDGCDVMGAVSLEKELPPVLVVTGGDMDDRYLARAMGASIVLGKPSPYAEIAEALGSLLRR